MEKDFGKTIEEIEKDGFEIHSQVDIELDESKVYATPNAIGTGILSISKSLAEIKPDFLVVYADRFEGFAAVVAGTQMNIPTAHIEGGDITEGGALDDSVRHAMTKLAHIHFTTNLQATNRILAMGESSWRVHTVGFPAIDLIKENNYANSQELVSRFSLDLSRPVLLFTQHSVTTEFELSEQQIIPSLKAIKNLSEEGIQSIITFPNNDVGGRKIIKTIKEFFRESENENIQIHKSIGRYYYHGILALSQAKPRKKVVCVGNSSSGIKETPAFGCPAVNIGSRQAGRLRADNVIDVDYKEKEISDAVHLSLEDKTFIKTCKETINPYGIGDAGIKIAKILSEISVDSKTILRKAMTLKGQVNKEGWFR